MITKEKKLSQRYDLAVIFSAKQTRANELVREGLFELWREASPEPIVPAACGRARHCAPGIMAVRTW